MSDPRIWQAQIEDVTRAIQGLHTEPIDAAFEAEVARLAGKRQEAESVEDHLKRIGRVRSGLRHWWPTQSEQALADACPHANEHSLMLSCGCGYLSRSASELIADARTSGYAHGAADIADRVLALLPKSGEYVGNCCEHCAAIEDLLEPVRPTSAPTCSPPADPPATASENGMNRPTYADGPAGGDDNARGRA